MAAPVELALGSPRLEGGGHAAVDGDRLAGDEGGGAAGEEADDAGDLAQLAPAAERGAALQPSRPFEVDGEVGIRFGRKRDRRDAVGGIR